jgi:hypothetical protein
MNGTQREIDWTESREYNLLTRDSLVFGWILENPVEEGRDIKLP